MPISETLVRELNYYSVPIEKFTEMVRTLFPIPREAYILLSNTAYHKTVEDAEEGLELFKQHIAECKEKGLIPFSSKELLFMEDTGQFVLDDMASCLRTINSELCSELPFEKQEELAEIYTKGTKLAHQNSNVTHLHYSSREEGSLVFRKEILPELEKKGYSVIDAAFIFNENEIFSDSNYLDGISSTHLSLIGIKYNDDNIPQARLVLRQENTHPNVIKTLEDWFTGFDF